MKGNLLNLTKDINQKPGAKDLILTLQSQKASFKEGKKCICYSYCIQHCSRELVRTRRQRNQIKDVRIEKEETKPSLF